MAFDCVLTCVRGRVFDRFLSSGFLDASLIVCYLSELGSLPDEPNLMEGELANLPDEPNLMEGGQFSPLPRRGCMKLPGREVVL
eukprot:2092704-Rhodomonas_salina.1